MLIAIMAILKIQMETIKLYYHILSLLKSSFFLRFFESCHDSLQNRRFKNFPAILVSVKIKHNAKYRVFPQLIVSHRPVGKTTRSVPGSQWTLMRVFVCLHTLASYIRKSGIRFVFVSLL